MIAIKFIYKWKFREFPFKIFVQVLTIMFDHHKGNLQIIGDTFALLGMKVPDGKNGPYVWNIYFLALVLGM